MKIFLCGQTGNVNRGCEAIVRSTVKVLNRRSGEIYLATFDLSSDRNMIKELGINSIEYGKYPTNLYRLFFGGIRKVFKKSLVGIPHYIERPLFSKLDKESLVFNIGGDTYCYGKPKISFALNNYTSKNKIPNILWCCSIEEDIIKKDILKDLKKYSYIFPREILTYNSLIKAGIPKEKIVKVCDPAFFLDKKEVELPKGFLIGNTLGINLSELVVTSRNSKVYENIKKLIQWTLTNSDMNICLIPHVYNIKKNKNDWPILKQLYDEIKSERVFLVDKEYDCEQLKYIISKCRFFIGARTHSTIAAYSSKIPTIVIGYSVKSKGIATDLFGSYKNYVLPYEEIENDNTILNAFQLLLENEENIKKRYEEILPSYKKQLIDAVNKYILNKVEKKDISILDSELCSGCEACTQICPQNCVEMSENEEGFLRPKIDYNKCIQCGQCKNICPVLNKPKDNLLQPKCYAAINKNQEIRLKSSSGGMFTLLAENIIKKGGVVFGAAFDKDFKVIHKAVENIQDLEQLRGSKYVQSEIGDSYKQAEKFLKSGQMVLFTGTPCQIGGLLAYLKTDYDNLITQDLICHGVPSPKVWAHYVNYREEKAASKTRRMFFRSKNCGWKTYSVLFEYENNSEYKSVLTKDYYMRAFLSHLCLRKSCHQCSFKQVHRQSDITLADFWGIENIFPEMNDNRGTSLVLIHSKKGERLLREIEGKTTLKEVIFSMAIKENKSYLESCSPSLFRSRFFNLMHKKRLEKLVEKYCGRGIAARIRRKAKKIFY